MQNQRADAGLGRWTHGGTTKPECSAEAPGPRPVKADPHPRFGLTYSRQTPVTEQHRRPCEGAAACRTIHRESAPGTPLRTRIALLVKDSQEVVSAVASSPASKPIKAKHQPWWPPSPDGMDEIAVEVEWNMWTRRLWPFKDLAESETIVCVSGGGPARGVLMYTTEVEHLVAARYESHEDGWRILSSGIPRPVLKQGGISRSYFLNHDYTAAAPASGWMLAWSSQPGEWLGLPRPDDLRFRQNGWAEMDSMPQPKPRSGRRGS